MKKNTKKYNTNTYPAIFLSFIISIAIIIILYWFGQLLGIEKKMNYFDQSRIVEWTRLAFNPKKYFRFFYNASIFFIPLSTILISLFVERLITNKKIMSKLSLILKSFKNFVTRYHLLIMLIMIFVVLFNFGYLSETGIWINYYHQNFLIAPINDLLHGKHLLVDTFSQYGTILAYVLYKIFQYIVPFSYMNFYLLFMIFTIIYYAILYFFLHSLTKDKLYSLVGLYFIMGINTLLNYPEYPYSENYVWPGATVVRYFFDISVFLLILRNPRFQSRKFLYVTSAIVSFSVLYNYETGLALLLTFVVLLFFNSFSLYFNSIKAALFDFIKKILPLSFFILLFLSSFSVYTYLVAGQWPDWSLFTMYVSLAHQGMSNIKTPVVGWHIPYLVFLFLTLIVIIRFILSKKDKTPWQLIVLGGLATYGLVLMNYYMGRSVNSNLTVVSIPGCILFIVLLRELTLDRSQNKSISALRTMIIAIIFLICSLSTYYLYKRLSYRWYSLNAVRHAKKYYGNPGFVMVNYNEEGDITADNLLKSVSAIKKLTKGSEKILLFSQYNTVILVMSEKTHILPLPVLEQIYFIDEIEETKRELISLKNKPHYIFVDKKNTLHQPPGSFKPAEEMFKSMLPYYTFYKQVGILDIYKLK